MQFLFVSPLDMLNVSSPARWGSLDFIRVPSLLPPSLPSFLPATANSRSEWAPPDLNCELQIRVGTPDFNPELQSSGHYQDINRYRQLQVSVGIRGPQRRAPNLSGHCWTPAHCRTSARRQRECQIECHEQCQNTCQKVCRNGCQIECQSICQKECRSARPPNSGRRWRKSPDFPRTKWCNFAKSWRLGSVGGWRKWRKDWDFERDPIRMLAN